MTEREFLKEILGNSHAIDLVETLGRISQGFDDLYDGDLVTKEQMVKVFWDALVTLPENPFYQQYFMRLHPLITMTCSDWQCANILQRGSDHDKTLAFVLRDNLIAVAIECSRIISGYNVDTAVEIRRYFHSDTLVDYNRDLDK